MKTAKGLTKDQVRDAKPRPDGPYKLTDRDSMYLLVDKSGSKTWRFNYRLPGLKKDGTIGPVQYSFTLGTYPEVDLLKARKLRDVEADRVKSGINPIEFHRAEKTKNEVKLATTFAGIAQEWIAANVPDENDPNDKQPGKWSKYYAQQVHNFMGRYVLNAPIGGRPISDIKSPDIAALCKSVGVRDKATGDERKAKGAPSIAILLKQWCGKIFSLAIATGRYEHNNPANGFDLKDAGVNKPKTKNNKALGEKELRELLAKLQGYSVKKPGQAYAGQRDTVIAIELLMLLMVRTVELRKAQWQEFNLTDALWTIPASRMKKGAEHVVPLPAQAIELLNELRLINPPAKNGTGWLFPNRRRGSVDSMSATTINRALGNMGFNGDKLFRAHGTRGTASTHLHSTKHDPLMVEAALAHKQKGVAGIYNQGDYLDSRRAMMQTYADWLSGLKVTNAG
ncbi:tyrosine-type recombinase/integrase [Paraburkholderia sp. GAS348]|uniref:tyrosine-type recombinase/integrase n=1 Tax=Paraburkholderia sp. GAS348 TaxID=3035132 RepID=UPI003D1CA0D8